MFPTQRAVGAWTDDRQQDSVTSSSLFWECDGWQDSVNLQQQQNMCGQSRENHLDSVPSQNQIKVLSVMAIKQM